MEWPEKPYINIFIIFLLLLQGSSDTALKYFLKNFIQKAVLNKFGTSLVYGVPQCVVYKICGATKSVDPIIFDMNMKFLMGASWIWFHQNVDDIQLNFSYFGHPPQEGMESGSKS